MIDIVNRTRTKVAVYQQSKYGNDYCGDGFFFLETDSYFICAMADGLGSGEGAFRSSALVMEMIECSHDKDVDQLIQISNDMLKQNRGVVLTIIKVNFKTYEMTYSNIGNVTFRLVLPSGEVVQPVPTRGFLSGRKQKVTKRVFAIQPNSLFAMYTDGINYGKFVHTVEQDPEQIVVDIEKRCKKEIDDATLIVGKLK